MAATDAGNGLPLYSAPKTQEGNMEFKWLGRTGVKVSQLCYGTMSFGGDADASVSAKMYAACRDAGINFFDCADCYSKGKAEDILGQLISGERDELIITSKCFVPMGDDVNARGGNRRHIVRAVEASLKRLRTDRLDVFFMHLWDTETPLEETCIFEARPGKFGDARESSLSGRQQLCGLADRQGVGDIRAFRLASARRYPTHVQLGQTSGRGGNFPFSGSRGTRRYDLQPCRRRPFER